MRALHEQIESLASTIHTLDTKCRVAADDSIETGQLAAFLWRNSESSDAHSFRADLDALCKKVAVGKFLCRNYIAGWKKPEVAIPLDQDGVAAVAAVLLRHAAIIKQNDSKLSGLPLKYLNAVFTLVHSLERGDDSHSATPDLRRIAEQMLHEVTRDHAPTDSIVL